MDNTAPSRTRLTVVLRRWPTALAAGIAFLSLGGGGSDQGVAALGNALMLLPLLYLIVAKLRRRQASWPVLAALVVPFVLLRALDVMPPSAFFSAVALAVLVWGAVDGQVAQAGAVQDAGSGDGRIRARSRWPG
ncbi:hypothetical protein [Nonomuraea dietziae]|uniref:hypothetical protein n=1 Tax=Nonomuraea dietziae TaxID=65515 RepID=UPI0031D711A3